MVGELVRPAIELAVAELLAGEGDGHGVGSSRRLGLEQLVDAAPRRDSRSAVSFHSHEELLLLFVGQERQVRQPRVGIAHDARQQMPGSGLPSARSWRRRTGRCCTRTVRAVRALVSVIEQREVELRHRPRDAAPDLAARRGASGTPTGAGWCKRDVLEDEHHLKQRVVAQVPLGLKLLDQPLEGQVLVRVGAPALASRTRLSSSRNAGLPPRSVRSTSVLTKNPISPSISGRLRFGDGQADDEILLAGVAVRAVP